jgi:hypothetical protein
MSRKSRNRKKFELAPEPSADEVLGRDGLTVHRLTGDLATERYTGPSFACGRRGAERTVWT